MNKDLFATTKDGISQAERLLDALMPTYVEIDSREIPDFIDFLYELSKKIKYYNEQNKLSGNWEDFFTSDPNLVVILLSKMDLPDMSISNAKKKAIIVNAKNIEEAENGLREYLIFINELYSSVNAARNRFIHVADTRESETMIYLFADTKNIGSTIYSYYAQALNLFSRIKSEQLDKGRNEFKGELDTETSYFNLEEGNLLEMISSSLSHLNNAFDRLMSSLSRASRAAKEFVDEKRFMNHQYQPQVGLVITFLELYSYLKKRLNGLVEKHLDYYYQEILGIKHEQLQPDYVHVVAELEDHAPRTSIGPNNLLLAETKDQEEAIFYKPERNLLLSRAKIKSIKTIFLSNYKQIESSSYRDVKEVQLFTAEHPLFNPIEYNKKTGAVNSWAVMGEDQHDLPKSERTMLTAEPGIAIVSSLFYQLEGNRKFTLTIELKSAKYPELNEYLNNYTKVRNERNERNKRNEIGRETVEHKLFFKAFNLLYSSTDGWERIQDYTIKIDDTDQAIAKLVVSFTLNHSDKAFDCYQESIHNELIDTNLPVLKLLLNPNVEHYAYSFLKSIQLNRVTIHISVKGFRALKLQNNVGPLSIAAPFQPFGPQPGIGSFLDIKNTNIFNRYLKDFSLKINWLELPRGKGGFGTYYNGYGAKLDNSAFKMNLSALVGGAFIPSAAFRQEFNLFEADSQTEELFNQSIITNIDLKKIIFQNEPQLKNELLFNDHLFREGAIRLEFCAPVEAFGHRLFPQIFPNVILNNSKKFKKKLPVPNQPYIPMVKTIELDFESEFSEGFNEGQFNNQYFQLFHLHPFGYQKIFPSSEKKNYYFLPQFDHSSNLIIGLEHIEPNTELSLFFQMEEKSFHHTLHNAEPVSWYFLDANEWIEFNPRHVISNSTGNFTHSGIICLKMPAEIPTQNTILPSGFFWIKASSLNNNKTSGKVTSIMVNGFLASRVMQEPAKTSLNLLKSNSITGFAQTVKGVQKVQQLFPSFGGIAAETNQEYYVRVSERLRHKNRPVQLRDLAQTILNHFPNILIVKLFNCRRENYFVIPDTDLHIVLIPKEFGSGKSLNEQPKVSLSELYRVKTFVSSVISPFVKFEVGNAIYERVKVICKVLFHKNEEADSRVLSQRFISDINRYIAPWLYEETSNISIGSKIYKAELLIYLKNLPYVEYISGFSLVQFTIENSHQKDENLAHVYDSAVKNIDVIQGETPTSILIPSPFHIVEVLSSMEYAIPEASGIGKLIIGEEFLITDGTKKQTTNTPQIDEDNSFGIIIPYDIA